MHLYILYISYIEIFSEFLITILIIERERFDDIELIYLKLKCQGTNNQSFYLNANKNFDFPVF